MAMIKTSWKKAKADNEKDDYSSIIPSGFMQKKYDSSIVPGGYIYHRCHIIAWALGGIDIDERNIMTGTRDFNMNGMKQFEDRVYNYLKYNKSNHVLYRVTPCFEGNNKLASGVNIEAYSIEDNGVLKFNVYVYNAQNGIIIDYATGESKLAEQEDKYLNLGLFDSRNNNNDFINKFIVELKNALKNMNVEEKNMNKKYQEHNLKEINNAIEEYNLYEKKKMYLDNKTKWGNNLAWIMDENSVCISEHGDGGPFSIKEINLPQNAEVGEVYEEVNGKYIYNSEITKEIRNIVKQEKIMEEKIKELTFLNDIHP